MLGDRFSDPARWNGTSAIGVSAVGGRPATGLQIRFPKLGAWNCIPSSSPRTLPDSIADTASKPLRPLTLSGLIGLSIHLLRYLELRLRLRVVVQLLFHLRRKLDDEIERRQLEFVSLAVRPVAAWQGSTHSIATHGRHVARIAQDIVWVHQRVCEAKGIGPVLWLRRSVSQETASLTKR